jgi:suppressor of fused
LGEDTSAPGWEAITRVFEELYPGQDHPLHRAPLIKHMDDISQDAAALDGISAYDAGDYWHFVTYGLTELYGKVCDDPARSGFGYEFTFKLAKGRGKPPEWAFQMLETVGKRVWQGGVFAKGHTIKTGPIDGRNETAETALLVLRDPAIPAPLATPHGSVDLLLLLGVKEELCQRVLAAYEQSGGQPGWEEAVVEDLRARNPQLVTRML